MKLRDNFPTDDSSERFGKSVDSEGYSFFKLFHEETLEGSYNKLKAFLKAEGYGDVGIPKDTDELYLMRDEDSNSFKHYPISIEFSSYHETAFVLRILNENYPNQLLAALGKLDRDAMISLKKGRIKWAIEFVEKAIERQSQIAESVTSPDELRAISETLLDLNFDKVTIIGGLLQNGFRHKLFTKKEVADEFGDAIAIAMYRYAHFVF